MNNYRYFPHPASTDAGAFSNEAHPVRKSAFTLIELLVVVAVIALLMAILLPSLSRARENTRTAACLSNLHQLALASSAYHSVFNSLPSPVTSVNEANLWFTALDPYLGISGPDDPTRPGVAGLRAYRKIKECTVWPTLSNDPSTPASPRGQSIKEISRTLKMNAHLQRVILGPANTNLTTHFARLADIPRPSDFVLFADGTAVDQIPWATSTYETQQFALDINVGGVGGIALRHAAAANVLFTDGHASTEKHPTYTRTVGTSGISLPSWQSEFVNTANTPVNSNIDDLRSMESQSLHRNPNMPLLWSLPGKLYRP